MTTYVDDMQMNATVPNGNHAVTGRWSHLMADTDEELHAFAARLGLKRAWAQYPGTWKSHYDVTTTKRAEAIRLGAVPLSFPHESGRYTRCRQTGEPFFRDCEQPPLF